MLKFLRRILGLSSPKEETASTTNAESNWCFIPAGTVMIHGARGSYVRAGKSEAYPVDEFSIAKYPVTNAEFERFIAADGYNLKEFWTKEGWHYRQQEGWIQPKFWDDLHFKQPNQPVVGITWYEAMAYCEWLDYSVDERGAVPLDLQITLPTEQQWQLAAQNDDDTLYPWGHQFIQTNANTKEANIGHTTPVTDYAHAVSANGVVDMAGNALEWTRTDWMTGSDDPNVGEANRVLRGGSFANSQKIATVSARTYSNAYFRRNNFGFRICAVKRSNE